MGEENLADAIERLNAGTWDLSPNDRRDIGIVLNALAAARREIEDWRRLAQASDLIRASDYTKPLSQVVEELREVSRRHRPTKLEGSDGH